MITAPTLVRKTFTSSEKGLVMNVNLNRTLKLKFNKGGDHVERTVVASQTYEEVQPKTHKEVAMPLALTGEKIKPTTSGTFVSCSYDYGVQAAVSWGSDIHVNLPVTVYAPQP